MMSDAISVDIRNVASNGGTGSAGTSGGGGQIAALKKQLASLQKKLKDTQSSRSQGAAKQAELIQQQIVALQARIADLESQQAKSAAAAGKSVAKPTVQPANAVQASPAKSATDTLGNKVDTFI